MSGGVFNVPGASRGFGVILIKLTKNVKKNVLQEKCCFCVRRKKQAMDQNRRTDFHPRKFVWNELLSSCKNTATNAKNVKLLITNYFVIFV